MKSSINILKIFRNMPYHMIHRITMQHLSAISISSEGVRVMGKVPPEWKKNAVRFDGEQEEKDGFVF